MNASLATSEITSVINAYFDALYYCDTDIISTVFHPHAIYVTADETPPLIRTMEEYLSVIEKRKSPASKDEPRYDHIDHIELAGENTAFVRVRCVIKPRNFVDLLTLIRTDEKWQIIAKAFHFVETH